MRTVIKKRSLTFRDLPKDAYFVIKSDEYQKIHQKVEELKFTDNTPVKRIYFGDLDKKPRLNDSSQSNYQTYFEQEEKFIKSVCPKIDLRIIAIDQTGYYYEALKKDFPEDVNTVKIFYIYLYNSVTAHYLCCAQASSLLYYVSFQLVYPEEWDHTKLDALDSWVCQCEYTTDDYINNADDQKYIKIDLVGECIEDFEIINEDKSFIIVDETSIIRYFQEKVMMNYSTADLLSFKF